MQYSVQISNDSTPWPTLQAIAETIDRGRWHTLWNNDHLVPPAAELMPHLTDDLERFEEGDIFEAWSMLAALAARTKRVRLGCLVTAMPFRNPALLAKTAVTVDHISNGRLELGLGAAWHTGETRAYGIALGTLKERLDRFEEGLEVLRLLFTPGARRSFKGRYFELDRAPFAPAPLQARIPVLIGGGGEKRTLRLVAQYADTYNYFGNVISSRAIYAHKSRVLDEHCAAIGRDPRDIRRSICLFGDVEPDAAKATATRDFLGKPLDAAGRADVLYGSAQYVIDGVVRITDGLGVDEVIFFGIGQHPDNFQRFDEEVLSKLPR